VLVGGGGSGVCVAAVVNGPQARLTTATNSINHMKGFNGEYFIDSLSFIDTFGDNNNAEISLP
jgi:hypothetical protein